MRQRLSLSTKPGVFDGAGRSFSQEHTWKTRLRPKRSGTNRRSKGFSATRQIIFSNLKKPMNRRRNTLYHQHLLQTIYQLLKYPNLNVGTSVLAVPKGERETKDLRRNGTGRSECKCKRQIIQAKLPLTEWKNRVRKSVCGHNESNWGWGNWEGHIQIHLCRPRKRTYWRWGFIQALLSD